MVPGAGIEPARLSKSLGILSPVRLPVSPPGHDGVGRYEPMPYAEVAIRCSPAADGSVAVVVAVGSS